MEQRFAFDICLLIEILLPREVFGKANLPMYDIHPQVFVHLVAINTVIELLCQRIEQLAQLVDTMFDHQLLDLLSQCHRVIRPVRHRDQILQRHIL